MGGSTPVGIFGCFDSFDELIKQVSLDGHFVKHDPQSKNAVCAFHLERFLKKLLADD